MILYILYYILLCYVAYIILYFVMLCCVVLYCIVLYDIIYIILRYVMFCYVMLCYVMLCYVMLFHWQKFVQPPVSAALPATSGTSSNREGLACLSLADLYERHTGMNQAHLGPLLLLCI